jgi:CRISPR-associated protein Csb2
MPEVSDMHKFELDRSQDKLLINRKLFPLSNGIVSYYFDTEPIPAERLNMLAAFQVGRGKSICFSHVSALDRLEIMQSTDTVQVWEPSASHGRPMAVPYPGFLRNLNMYYDAGKRSSEVERVYTRYSTHAAHQRQTLYKLRDENGEVVSLPGHRVNEVAGMLRCAVMKRVSPKLHPYVSGHTCQHVSYVPLPTVGPYTDGRIRRAVIIEPIEAPALPASIAELPLVTHDEKRIATAVKETETDGVFDSYLNPSQKWVTVTPVILSGFDDGKRTKRQRLLAKMFRHAGLPQPLSITEFPLRNEFVVNTKHGHDRYPRMMCAVAFAEEVIGVVGIGTGRNYGLGIFANLSSSATV